MLNKNSVRLKRDFRNISNYYGVCPDSAVHWAPLGDGFGQLPWFTKKNIVLSQDKQSEVLDPIESFLSQNFEVPISAEIIVNFLNFCSNVLTKSILDFIEEDDIFLEDTGAISIEIHKNNIKTFISIGRETCGYYIRNGDTIVLQENSLNLGSIHLEPKFVSLKNELLKHYQHPIVTKLYHRLKSQSISELNEI